VEVARGLHETEAEALGQMISFFKEWKRSKTRLRVVGRKIEGILQHLAHDDAEHLQVPRDRRGNLSS
jgi:hypothetical protein